jgi:hypothetical protein
MQICLGCPVGVGAEGEDAPGRDASAQQPEGGKQLMQGAPSHSECFLGFASGLGLRRGHAAACRKAD